MLSITEYLNDTAISAFQPESDWVMGVAQAEPQLQEFKHIKSLIQIGCPEHHEVLLGHWPILLSIDVPFWTAGSSDNPETVNAAVVPIQELLIQLGLHLEY